MSERCRELKISCPDATGLGCDLARCDEALARPLLGLGLACPPTALRCVHAQAAAGLCAAHHCWRPDHRRAVVLPGVQGARPCWLGPVQGPPQEPRPPRRPCRCSWRRAVRPGGTSSRCACLQLGADRSEAPCMLCTGAGTSPTCPLQERLEAVCPREATTVPLLKGRRHGPGNGANVYVLEVAGYSRHGVLHGEPDLIAPGPGSHGAGSMPHARRLARHILLSQAVTAQQGADVMHALWEADVVCYRADMEDHDGDLQDRFWISDNRRVPGLTSGTCACPAAQLHHGSSGADAGCCVQAGAASLAQVRQRRLARHRSHRPRAARDGRHAQGS